MKTFAIDFETFFDKKAGLDVGTMGPWHYARATDIFLLSVVGDDGFEWVGHPGEFDWTRLHGARVVAHNYAFDGELVQALREKGVVPSTVRFAEEHCTADLSVYCGYGRALADVVLGLFNAKLSKTIRDKMNGVKFSELTEDQRELFLKYSLDDSRWCLKVWQALSPFWSAFERRVSVESRKAGKRGSHINWLLVEHAVEKTTSICEEEIKFIPWAASEKPLSLPALRSYCIALNIEPPETTEEDDPAYVAWESRYGETTDVIQHLRRYRKANIIRTRCERMARYCRPDGTMALELKYFGAQQTGRFSGTNGFNPQNLSSSLFEGIDLRAMIIPGPGYKFILSDLSQIEPRTLAWLAGNERLLSAIRKGYGVYEAYSQATGMWSGAPGTMKKENKALYAAAKGQVLGCGYGMGPKTFYDQARALTGGEYQPTSEESVKAVNFYRFTHPETVQFWNLLEKNYKSCAGKDFILRLPSGRPMNYWKVSAKDWTHEKAKGLISSRRKTYGGRLAENATQATARDIFCDIAIRAIDAGFDYSFTVHDELIFKVPQDNAERDLKSIEKIMTTPPEWMSDIPLGCESKITDKYEK